MKKWKTIAASALGVAIFAVTTACAGIADTQANAVIRTESGRYINGMIYSMESKMAIPYEKEVFELDAFKAKDGSIVFANIKHEAKNDVPVYVRISDNGTPENFADDKAMEIGFAFSEYMDECIKRNDEFIRHMDEFIATFERK